MKKLVLSTTLLFLVSTLVAQDLPVSDRSYNNSEEIFRFAIVSDRTGGMRGGVFEEAIGKVEMLQPEFVLSVGDLIDGYTEDPEVWNAQWDEFDAIINKLSMPFYYVPGNHDTSNELLTEVWRVRHGRDYYHFKYKDVLFLALNTDEVEGGGIAETQVEYFEKVLEENQDAKWTLLFMHRPVWSYGDRMGYDGIEKALGNRNYTLFSGHHHHYRYKIHNGMEHFTLATTGGGSWIRNPDVGEFDHITWVTMKEKGPDIAHIDIDGIFGKDLVPERDYADIQVLRQGNWLDVKPFVNGTETFGELPVTFTFTNASERTFDIMGELREQNGIRFEPELLETSIDKGTNKKVSIKAISVDGTSSIADLNNTPLLFEMTAGFERETRNNIFLSTSKRLFLDWKHTISKASNKISIDGEFSDWKNVQWIDVRNPQYIKEDWDWKGAEDGRFEFATSHDSEELYLAIKFFDEKIIIDKEELLSRQDKFFIHIDSNIKDSEFKKLEVGLSSNNAEPHIDLKESTIKKFEVAISESNGNQFLELSIPFKEIGSEVDLSSVRINIGIMDHDRPENTKPSILWWRPLWGNNLDYEGSGMFWLEK